LVSLIFPLWYECMILCWFMKFWLTWDFFNAWGFWFAILLLSLNQIFLWNHRIHWLNFELSFWEQRSQILTLGTKLLIRLILTFWRICVGMGGWTNIRWWHVKLQIGNGFVPSTGGNLILNFPYSLRVDYKCNKVAPVFFLKNGKLRFKGIANFVGLDE